MKKTKQQAFMAAYRPHHDAFLRYCSALAYGKMDLDDLVQDVLMGAYEHFDRIEKKDQLLHYLIRAARNRSISIWRKSSRMTELKSQHIDRLTARGTSPEVALDVQLLYKTLQKLPEKQKDAVILFEICGFSMKEIAQLQESTEGAIKTKISRGRKKLKALLQEKIIPALLLLLWGKREEASAAPNPEGFDELFELARQLPTEIPVEEALEKAFSPLIPVPTTEVSQLIGNISLNNVAIGLTTSAVLAGGLYMATVSQAKQEVIGYTAAPIKEAISLEKEDKSVTDISTITEKQQLGIAAAANLMPDFNPPVLPEMKITGDREGRNMEQMSFLSLNKLDDLFSLQLPTISPKGKKSPNPTMNQAQDKECEDCDLFDEDTEDKKVDQEETPRVEDNNYRGLRNKLLKNLLQDQLIESREERNRVSFYSGKVVVNRIRIPNSLQQKYLDLLKSYDIHPRNDRIVEITPKYLAVGWVTKEEGFKGNVNGTVDLQDLNRIKLKDLKPLANNTKKYEERPINEFHTLKVDGLAVVYLSNGPSDLVKVSVAGMPIQDLITKEENGVLTITTIGEHSGEQIRVEVSAPKLEKIVIAGAAELRSKQVIKADALEVITADVGAAWLDVQAQSVKIKMEGGDLKISGSTNAKEVFRDHPDSQRGKLSDYSLKIAN